VQVLYLSGANRPGLLTALSAGLRELGLEVSKAVVETDAEQQKIADKFYVTRQDGGKVTDPVEVANIKKALGVLLRSRAGPQTPRPKFTTVSIQQDENKRELLYTLMGGCCSRSLCGTVHASSGGGTASCTGHVQPGKTLQNNKGWRWRSCKCQWCDGFFPVHLQ
jgi:hypothetical protein